jgi:L-seryl-tRNA(Ser) seleniumtransferase
MSDLSRLPQVDALLRTDTIGSLVAHHGRKVVTDAIRETIEAARASARQGAEVPDLERITAAVVESLAARARAGQRRVLNATGVVLHTNLGRAPLSDTARKEALEAAGYCDLEYDLATGARGARGARLEPLLAEAAGAEAAIAVNNAAAALVLVLACLARGREVLVSRGELVEIGGSFRLPDIMSASGATMREVGTTNRTRLEDYRAAIGTDTAVLLKAHRAGYTVTGATEEVGPAALAELGRETGIPVVHVVGSGLLAEVADGPLAAEPSVAASVGAGVDLVVLSADKLLGGPQAGVLAGPADLVLRVRAHPVARALELDKLRIAALEATLDAHLRTAVPLEVPTIAMLSTPSDTLRQRAEWLAAQLGDDARAIAVEAPIGSGVLPGIQVPSWAVELPSGDAGTTASGASLTDRLRQGNPPVIARHDGGRVLLDLRTVPPSQDAELLDLVLAARHPPA